MCNTISVQLKKVAKLKSQDPTLDCPSLPALHPRQRLITLVLGIPCCVITTTLHLLEARLCTILGLLRDVGVLEGPGGYLVSIFVVMI